MKKFLIPTVVVVVVVLIIGFLASTFNTFVGYETDVKKFNRDSENHLSSYTMKVQETAQVPDAYRAGLRDVIRDTFQGRYGQDGSKAVVQWIQEQNIQFDSSLYKQIQIVISSGRDEFRISQTKKLDACAQYEKSLNRFPGNIVAGIAGFPRIDLDDTCKVVSDTRTQDAFKTGLQTPINIKGSN